MENLRDAVIALCLRDAEFLEYVLGKVPFEKVFPEKFHLNLLHNIRKFAAKYGKCTFADIDLLLNHALETKGLSEEKYELYKAYLERLRKIEVNKEFIKDKLDDFIKHEILTNAILKAQMALESQNYNEVISSFEEAISLSTRVESKIENVLDEASVDLTLMKENPETSVIFDTGFPPLDEYIQGIHVGDLVLFIAYTNVGKTWSLVYLFREAILNGVVPLLITLEMPKEAMKLRYYMSITGATSVPDRETFVMTEDLTDVDQIMPNSVFERAEDIRNLVKHYNSFTDAFIVDMTDEMFSPNKLRSLLEEFKLQYKRYPEVILIDTPDLMVSDRRISDLRHESIDIYKNLKNIAAKYNAGMIVVSQANRQAENKLWVTGKETAEDISKLQRADIAVSISQTELENQLKIARLLLLKNRYGPKGKKFVIRQNFDIGQFLITGRELKPEEPIPCIPEDTKRLVLDKVYSFLNEGLENAELFDEDFQF